MQALRVTRLQIAAQIEVERMRLDSQRQARIAELVSRDTTPETSVLRQAWEDLQALKNALDELIASSRGSYGPAIEKMWTILDRVRENYARLGAIAPLDARAIWHDAKNISYELRGVLSALPQSRLRRRVLSAHVITRLRELRDLLSFAQIGIGADAKQTRAVAGSPGPSAEAKASETGST
jgi:hypothetical protein